MLACGGALQAAGCRPTRRRHSTRARPGATASADAGTVVETDMVVIGAGLGGLCAAALLARYGKRVVVCESHSVAGGAAHTFTRQGFHFESGPSLYSSLSPRSNNPLAQVLHALQEPLPVLRYNTWRVHVPEFTETTQVGTDQFAEVLERHVDAEAARQWRELVAHMVPLSASSTAVPAAAVRTDGAALITLARFLPRLLHNGGSVDAVKALLRPYSEYVDGKVTHPFLLRWMDLLCFLLSGAPASGTVAAEIGYMFADWYRPGASLEYPVGGSGAIVAALLRGFAKFGGQLRLNAHVSNILVEEGRACGVRLRDGTTVRAQTVISNASIWDTLPMLPSDALPPAWRDAEANTEHCPSFMHLHLGIDAQGLDLPEVHHISVESWHQGVTSPQNLVLVSVPSVLDPALAPQGCHVIHAYTPATEPWALWEHLQPGSDAYEALKRERSEVLWRAVEKAVPGVRARVRVQMVGTPKTHARFLRRSQGSYGGTGWLNPEAGGAGGTPAVPTPETPLPGLLCVGDSRFPGPGVPAVAASGMAAAHSLVPFWQQCALLDECVP